MLRRLFASTSKLPARAATTAAVAAPTPVPTATPTIYCRLLHTTPRLHASQLPIPHPRPDIATPIQFLKAISYPPHRDLSTDGGLTALMGEGEGEWEKLWELNGQRLRKAGVPIKHRRYLLWAMEKFRQGLDPQEYKIRPKKKKVVRGWGPRVQKGIRVSGRKRPGEKSPPSR